MKETYYDSSTAANPTTPDQYFFILASGSPRRKELLEFLGISFSTILPELSSTSPSAKDKGSKGIDETPLPGETPPDLVHRLSRAKALAVANNLPSIAVDNLASADRSSAASTNIIIAADTVVVLEDKILGKPADPTEATQMLTQLRRQCHYVYSGLTVAVVPSITDYANNPSLITRFHQSKVWMRPYSNAEIEAYVDSGDPLDKAGAYAIQNKDFTPVERLEGCFASVMGLPLGELLAALKEIGLSFPMISQQCCQYSGYTCCLETIDC